MGCAQDMTDEIEDDDAKELIVVSDDDKREIFVVKDDSTVIEANNSLTNESLKHLSEKHLCISKPIEKDIPKCKNLRVQSNKSFGKLCHVLTAAVNFWDTLVLKGDIRIPIFANVQLRGWADEAKCHRFYFGGILEQKVRQRNKQFAFNHVTTM